MNITKLEKVIYDYRLGLSVFFLVFAGEVLSTAVTIVTIFSNAYYNPNYTPITAPSAAFTEGVVAGLALLLTSWFTMVLLIASYWLWNLREESWFSNRNESG